MAESFVVRLLTNRGQSSLVGELEVVATGRRLVFRSGDELLGLLRSTTSGIAEDPDDVGAQRISET